MRGIGTGAISNEQLPGLTPFEGGMAEALMDAPLARTKEYSDRIDASKGEKINPAQLEVNYPGYQFGQSMTKAEAEITMARQKMRRTFEDAQNLRPGFKNGFQSLSGSLVGSLLDPVSNGVGLLAGAGVGVAARFAGVSASSLMGRVGAGVVDNFIGNMAVEAPNAYLADKINDPYDMKSALGMNIGMSVAFGVPHGLFKHYFRASPELAKRMESIVENRVEAGLSADVVRDVMDAHVAAENSGTHFPYQQQPFTKDQPFYSGSKVFTEDFHDGEHAIRADIGHERGVQLFDNENLAHAGALTAESGNNGSVFTHDLKNMNIIDGSMKLSDLQLNSEETGVVGKSMFEKYGLKGGSKLDEPTINVYKHALDEFIAGRLTTAELERLGTELDASPLGRPFLDVGLEKSFRAFEKFVKFSEAPEDFSAQAMTRMSAKDALMYMQRTLEQTEAARLSANATKAQKKSFLATQRKLLGVFDEFVKAWNDDIHLPVKDMGTEALVGFAEKMKKTDYMPVKWENATVREAYDAILKAHYGGQLSMAEVVAFERALKADGIGFTTDNFRGQKHEPTNGVYVFDRDRLSPTAVKQADQRAVGKMTKERVEKFQAKIGDRLFDYTFDKNDGIWKQMESLEKQFPDGTIQSQIKAIDETFESAAKNLDETMQFEGHLDAEEQRIYDEAKKEFAEAGQVEKQLKDVKGCLR